MPPEQPPEIFVAAAGPQDTARSPANLGDGLILSNLSFPDRVDPPRALSRRPWPRLQPRRDGRFTKVLHLHVSVARDGAAARRFCRRMAVNGLIGGHLLNQAAARAARAGCHAWRRLRTAIGRARPLKSWSPLISERMIEESGIVVAGAPAECLAQLDEVLRLAKPYRFDIVDMASPLGPDWGEAIDIICQEILPELERRSLQRITNLRSRISCLKRPDLRLSM